MTYFMLGRRRMEAGKIICLLRSYAAHAEEMGSAVSAEPEFFLKPRTSIIHNGDDIIIPRESEDVYHEVELAVVIGTGGRFIPREGAMNHVLGYGVLIDVTARDIQARAKKAGKPWTVAKGYDTFAPISDIVPVDSIPDPHELDIWLKVNGEFRQRSNTKLMLFKIPDIIASISRVMALEPGDIIATGTPEGVSRIVSDDSIEAGIEKVGTLNVRVR